MRQADEQQSGKIKSWEAGGYLITIVSNIGWAVFKKYFWTIFEAFWRWWWQPWVGTARRVVVVTRGQGRAR